jgi:hypothetical protein
MTALLTSILSLYALWLFYLAVMALKRARDAGQLTTVAYVLGLPMLVVGLALDVLVNWFVMTLLLLELPREATVTARLRRHKGDPEWRGKVSRWFALHLLDTFDPSGRHI